MASEPTKLDDGGLAQNMSLRDWYAGKALANLYTDHSDAPDRVACWAYQVADEMLAERKRSALPTEAADTAKRRGGLETGHGETHG